MWLELPLITLLTLPLSTLFDVFIPPSGGYILTTIPPQASSGVFKTGTTDFTSDGQYSIFITPSRNDTTLVAALGKQGKFRDPVMDRARSRKVEQMAERTKLFEDFQKTMPGQVVDALDAEHQQETVMDRRRALECDALNCVPSHGPKAVNTASASPLDRVGATSRFSSEISRDVAQPRAVSRPSSQQF